MIKMLETLKKAMVAILVPVGVFIVYDALNNNGYWVRTLSNNYTVKQIVGHLVHMIS